jgi:hypothetical protein
LQQDAGSFLLGQDPDIVDKLRSELKSEDGAILWGAIQLIDRLMPTDPAIFDGAGCGDLGGGKR